MLCHAAYGCVMHEPPTDIRMTLVDTSSITS